MVGRTGQEQEIDKNGEWQKAKGKKMSGYWQLAIDRLLEKRRNGEAGNKKRIKNKELYQGPVTRNQ